MANHYVSPSGSAAWAASTSIDTPTSIATANASVQPGDIVYLRGGTYYRQVCPAVSGTSGSRIVYAAYEAEVPTITETDTYRRYAIKLQDRSYVTVDGISSQDSLMFYYIGYGACYNEIKNCAFDKSSYLYSVALISNLSTAGEAGPGSNHNWIHDNIFSRYGRVTSSDEIHGIDSGTIRIGAGATDPSSNNTIEDNVFFYGGHDLLDIGGYRNVARGNIFHNDEAYFADSWGTLTNSPTSGYFGNRCIILTNYGNGIGSSHDNLVEGNRIGHAGCPPDDDGANGVEDAGFHTITRYNYIYGNGAAGYYNKKQASYASAYRSGSMARVYNNTIYHNGYGDDDLGTGYKYDVLIWSYSTYDDWPYDVVVKNNIVYGGAGEFKVATSNVLPQITYENNWNTDPLFTNPTLADKASLTLPDLTLQPESHCIRAGMYLTFANGAGINSTLLAVDDAQYFQDGTWGSALSDMRPDWIAVGSVTNVVEIESIDYGLNVIALASPMTWADGALVWLYKKSDGIRVLYGNAPETGAYPYALGAPTDSPIVPANAAVGLASSVPTLSPGADGALIVGGADFSAECDSPILTTDELGAYAIRLGPIYNELTLPAPNWRVGERARLRVARHPYISRVDFDDGSVRHHYRTNAPRSWTFEWARLSAAAVLGIRNLAALNEPLHFQNRIEGADWTWVIIEEFDPVPIAASFATGTPFYRATLRLVEAL